MAAGSCTVVGTSGPDRLVGTARADVICGLGGSDTISGLGGNDVIDGGGGNDTLSGGGGQDRLLGSAGTDTLSGGAGGDVFSGGTGTDKVTYMATVGDVTADFDGVKDDGVADEGDSITTSVEGITGGSGDDTLTGSAGPDTLTGGPGDDELIGGDGSDRLLGAAGEDQQSGGAGDDYLDGGPAPDNLDGGAGANVCVFDAEDVVSPTCDSTAPAVVSVSAPSAVDTSSSAQVVTVQAHVTDNLSGTACVMILLRGPDDQMIQNGCASRTSGTELDGVYELGLTLARYAQQGDWRIAIATSDTARNHSSWTSHGTVSQTAVGDTTVPTVRAVSAPSAVDTSASAHVVTVRAEVTDDLSGADCVFIALFGPGGQLIQNGCATRISGTELDGVYELDLRLPRYAQEGTWDIRIETADRAGNQKQLGTLGTVTQTGAGDGTAPAVLSSASTPATVDTSASPQVVTIGAEVAEDLSGTACVFMSLRGPGGQMVGGGCAIRTSGTDLGGSYELDVTVPQYAEQGTWRIVIQASDNAGNHGYHDSSGTLLVGS